MMDLAQLRDDTIGCDKTIHLNNAGAALMPKQVADAIRDYITEEEQNGGYELAELKAAAINDFYSAAAQLLGCNSNNIAFTTNATDSYSRALSAIDFKQGDVVLITENDYPSNFIAFIALQKRFGIQLILVGNTDTGEIDLEDLEAKLIAYAPKLVSVSHVPTSSGLVQPVNEIGKIIKKYDTLYLLDACQSLGQMAVDAVATQADFISGTFRKFLRGPRGAGILYVSDKALNAGYEPLFLDLRGAEWMAKNEYKVRADARRFEDWETAYALMMGSKAAIQYLLAIGIENIEARNKILAFQLKEKLMAIPTIHLMDKGKKQCNIITFSVENKLEAETKAYFKSKRINIYTTSKSSAIIDFAEKGIDWVVRVSPHYYNTEDEISIFISVVKEFISE